MSEKDNNQFYQDKLLYLNEKASEIRALLASNQKEAADKLRDALKRNRRRLFIINCLIFALWTLLTILNYTVHLGNEDAIEGIGTVGIGFIHGLITEHLRTDINDDKKDLDKMVINWENQVNNLDKSFNLEQQGLEKALDIIHDKPKATKKKSKKK